MVNIVSLRILGSASLIVALRASEGAHGLLLKRAQSKSLSGGTPEGCDQARDAQEWSEFFELYDPPPGGVGLLGLPRKVKSSPTSMQDALAHFCLLASPDATEGGEIQNPGLTPDFLKVISSFDHDPLFKLFKKAKPAAREFLKRLLEVKGKGWNDGKRMSRLADVLLRDHLGALNQVGESKWQRLKRVSEKDLGALETAFWTPDDLKALHAFYINDDYDPDDIPSVATSPRGYLGLTPSEAVFWKQMSDPVLHFVAHACVHQYVQERMMLTADKEGGTKKQQKAWLIDTLRDPEEGNPMENPLLASWSEKLVMFLHSVFHDADGSPAERRVLWMADMIRKHPVAFGALSTEIAVRLPVEYYAVDKAKWLEEKWGAWSKCLGALLESYANNFIPGEQNRPGDLFETIVNYTTSAPVAMISFAAGSLAKEVCPAIS
jgi:hypothetical protein